MRRRFLKNGSFFDYSKYMTIEVLEDGFTVSADRSVEYNVNGKGWNHLAAGFKTQPASKGDLLSFRCVLNIGEEFGSFKSNGKAVNLLGNVLSLIFGDSVETDISAYSRVFSNTFNGYRFPNIINIDKKFLSATTLAAGCYSYMFDGCTSLVEAPELPATTLAPSCYRYMFNGCSNLNYIKMLATDISATDCLTSWVYGVSSTGTFVKSKDATWNVVGVSGIPNGWKIEYDHNYDIGSDISFHIDRIDETLYAKDWMTWDDWVHSKYNTVSACIWSYEIIIYSYSSYPLDTYPNNIIKNGGTYYFRHFSGGSD